MIPEVHGGLGLSLFETALIAERLGWWATPGPWTWHALAGKAIADCGSEAQKAKWLPALASGAAVGVCADQHRKS